MPLPIPSIGHRKLPLISAGVLLGITLISSVKVIPAGNVGVKFSALKGISSQPLTPGVHLVAPLIDHITLYDTRLQEVTLAHGSSSGDAEQAIRGRSKEGLDITADVTVQFRVNAETAPALHRELGRNYVNTMIRPQVRSKVRDAVGQFSAADIISTQRQQVEASITSALREIFTKNDLELDSVLLRELRIPDSVAKVIEEKQTAEQQVSVERNKLQQANISAQRAVVEAEGAAKAAVAKARGEAEALSLRGRALRENPQLIQLTVAEKLAPSIQTVMLPSEGNFLLDIKGLTTGKSAVPAAKP